MPQPIPFHQIRAFEAAVRNLSFSRAAKELNVQQPAISRHVAALEADIGTPLFIRSKPRLNLTKEGEMLSEAVASGFSAIRQGLEAVRARTQDETIVISASIGFASLYLLPRMAEFQAAFPETKLQIITRDQNDDFDPRDCDVVILFGTEGLRGAKSRLIFGETMVAVCHPDVLVDGKLMELPVLAQQRLLHLSHSDHSADWDQFFAGSGLVLAKPSSHDSFHSYMVYLRAIQNGLGIGIGWEPILTEFLENRSLRIASAHECKTSRGYYCSVTPSGANKTGATLFLDWIGQSA